MLQLEEFEIAVAPFAGKLRVISVNGRFEDDLPLRIFNAANLWLEGRLSAAPAARYIRNTLQEIGTRH